MPAQVADQPLDRNQANDCGSHEPDCEQEQKLSYVRHLDDIQHLESARR